MAERNPIILSSDDEDELLPLCARIARRNNSNSDTILPLKPSSSIHSISDSEDSEPSSEPERKKLAAESPVPRENSSSPLAIDFIQGNNDCSMVLPNIPDKDSGCFLSSDSTEPRLVNEEKQAKKITRKRNLQKTEKSEERLKERERRRQEKLLDKALKDIRKEVQRSAKPEECIKSMRIAIDDGFSEVSEFDVLCSVILDSNIVYTQEKNPVPLSVQWFRRVTDVDVVNNQVQKNERDQLEDILVIYVPPSSFVDLVYAFMQKSKGKPAADLTIIEYIASIQDSLPHMKVTVVTVGLQPYLGRKAKDSESDDRNTAPRKTSKCVYKRDVDEAVVALNIQLCVSYYALKDMESLGHLLARFTKAIAEAPFKRAKQQQQLAFSWYAEADSSCPVKVDKDGKGMITLWQQQIQQFNNVGRETAQAIAAKFPSPFQLMQAYKNCGSRTEAEKLLQDIIIRREYGPLGTTRRVGPELSYKIWKFFTSRDGNEFLRR